MHLWTWQEVYTRLQDAPPGKLWGIPRGGQIVAGLTGRAVDTPDEADVIVDDIVESGTTQQRYTSQYGKSFWALHVKQPGDSWHTFPWEMTDPLADLSDTVRRQLEWIGEDPQREGLRDTPQRYLRMLQEMTQGYHEDPAQILGTVFTEPCDEMIVVRAIPFWSLCEHHLLPFHGLVSVGYIPADNRVIGLSKIPRLVRCFAQRLQIQERLTNNIATTCMNHLQPLGVGVIVNAHHICMHMRGVRSDGIFTTSCLLGRMREPSVRAEFLALHRSSTL